MNIRELYDKAIAAEAADKPIIILAFVSDGEDEVNVETPLEEKDVSFQNAMNVTLFVGTYP